MTKETITRFAPSPTGMLHIGGARTALFCYLFAKNTGGKYLLRIEDTDKERSTIEAKEEIIKGLNWLGIPPDGKIYYQSEAINRHKEVAEQLVRDGKAYYCYASKEELDALRQEAMDNNQRFQYDRRWRDRDPKDAPKDQKPVIRIKTPLADEIKFKDSVQGEITVNTKEIDDYVILRSDSSPTYMLSVVVDDYDMGITHVIRGADHLTNTPKQIVLYNLLGWDVPEFCHIPLIHGEDGKKMSKRHGATAVSEYEKMGFLPVALRNYLLRLGFSHGDDEIISDEQAIEWFNLDSLGKSPARFDMKKLESLNAHYLHEADPKILLQTLDLKLSSLEEERYFKIIPEITKRAKTLINIRESLDFIKEDFSNKKLTEKAENLVNKLKENKQLELVKQYAEDQEKYEHQALYESAKVFCEENNIKMKDFSGGLRAALTASDISPSIFEIMQIFGKIEVLKRISSLIS